MSDEGNIAEEVGVSQAILRQSRATYLVADHSKFERSAPARIGSLSEIDVFFTDAPLTAGLTKNCAQWGTKTMISHAQVPAQGQSAR